MKRMVPFLVILMSVTTPAFSAQSEGVTYGNENLQFIEYEFNPVLDGSVSWPYVAAVCPWILYEDGIYKMWFHGRGAATPRIGYATSSDGISWSIYPDPVLEPLVDSLESDEQSVKYPSIIDEGDEYRRFFWLPVLMG
jgi:hypothetical protein